MNAKILRPAVIALIRTVLLAGIGLSLTVPAHAQKSAAEALQKARVVERLSEGMAVEKKGEAPGFVLDPAWPQPLPNHWVIGDVGGIAVDKHNQIWVYHRPRSVGSQDSGMQGAAGKLVIVGEDGGGACRTLGQQRPGRGGTAGKRVVGLDDQVRLRRYAGLAQGAQVAVSSAVPGMVLGDVRDPAMAECDEVPRCDIAAQLQIDRNTGQSQVFSAPLKNDAWNASGRQLTQRTFVASVA